MGIPKAKWGCASNESPNRFGDPQTKRGSPNPHTKTGIPRAKWGCASNESPNRFGDPQTKMGIKTSPYQNGDPRTEMGMHKTMNPQTDSGIPEPKWRSRHPHTKTGIPKPKWGCESQGIHKPIRGSPNRNGDQYIPIPKRGSRKDMGIVQSLTRIGLGFVFIWDFRFSSPNWNGIQNGDPMSKRGSPNRFG